MSQSILELPPPPPGARIAYGSDSNQFAELRLPSKDKGPWPVVIFIHGGYWRKEYDLTHANHLCVALNAAGWATWSIEYRRLGQPGGGYPGTMEDIRLAAKHLGAQTSLDLNKVVVSGHSAGGQLALWLAAQNAIPLRGVVALAAVSDLRRGYELKLSGGVVGELMGGSPAEVSDRYKATSPIELLPIAVPQTLLHGAADDIVPFVLSEAFARVSTNGKLIPLPGAGHFELIDPRSKEFGQVRASIQAFLN